VTGVESARPPITASASGRCSSAPAPSPSASGSSPNSVQNGRHQDRPQTDAPGVGDRGLERLALRVQLLGEVEQHDPVLDHEAHEQDQPIADEMFRSMP
jgi:hypothetical protein